MFEETQIRERSRGTQGVTGIKLNKDAKIISSLNVTAEELIFVTENGFGNKVSTESYNIQNRGGQGVISIKTSDRNGKVVGAVNVDNDDFIILIPFSISLYLAFSKLITLLPRLEPKLK